MKFLQKRPVAAVIMILAILASVLIGRARNPADTGEPSTAIVGTYTYVYDNAGVLTDETMAHIDAMNVSLFAQTGAQILVETVDTTGDKTMEEYAIDLGNQYHVGDAERNNGLVILLALDNIAQNGLVGDYWVVGGDGLASYGNELTSLLVTNMETDFAVGDYDAGVEKTFDAYIDWFSDFYDVTIRENYIPAVRDAYSNGSGYYTQSYGYFAPTLDMLMMDLSTLLVVLLAYVAYVLLNMDRIEDDLPLDVAQNAVETVETVQEPSPAKDPGADSILKAFILLIIAAGIGTYINAYFDGKITLPTYMGAMIVALIIRNVSDWRKIELPMHAIDISGNVCLNIFLAIALMTLKLWELAALAVPMIVTLLVQTLIMFLFASFIVFRVMGRDYEAACMTTAFCGFGMGATPNAMANMLSVTGQYGPAPKAFFVVPIVGGMFVDFTNTAVLSVFLNFLPK